MDPKPRRGRLRRWAALLSALVSRGGAWVRRAARALRHRLARRAALLVKRDGRRRGEVRDRSTAPSAPGEDTASSNPPAKQNRNHPAKNPRISEEEERRERVETSAGENLRSGNPPAAQQDSSQTSSARTPPPFSEEDEGEQVEGKNANNAASAGPVNPSAAQGNRGYSSSAKGPLFVEEEEREPGEASDATTASTDGENTTAPSPRRAPARASTRLLRLLNKGATATPTPPAPAKPASRATTAARRRTPHPRPGSTAQGNGPWSSGGERTTTGDLSAAPGPAKEDPQERAATRRQAASKSTGDDSENPLRLPLSLQAAEIDDTKLHVEGEDATATPGADRVAEGVGPWSSGGQHTATGDPSAPDPATSHAALDAPPGGSDAVLGLAASPADASGKAGGSSSRARPRRQRMSRKKAKEANTRQTQPRLEDHQWEEEDEAIEEDIDREIEMHQTYKKKAAGCRKGYTYCLMCHLENRETELRKDKDTVVQHGQRAHQYDGILCKKKGCFTRARYNREIGLHEYVCHKLS